jgi:hypothetical protein
MDKTEKGKEFIRPWAESGPHASTQRTHGLLESWPVPGGCWAGRALDGLHVQMACRLAVVARSERRAADCSSAGDGEGHGRREGGGFSLRLFRGRSKGALSESRSRRLRRCRPSSPRLVVVDRLDYLH